MRVWQARVCMSVSSTLIARSNEQWELHESWRESFFFFRFPCFCSLLPHFFFFIFWRFSNLLAVRIITPTVTCQWYVIIFSFLLLLLMGNDLGIACFCNSLRLLCNSLDRSTSQTSHWLSSKFEPKLMKVHESAWELMRVGGQTRARVVTLIHSHPRLIRPLIVENDRRSTKGSLWEIEGLHKFFQILSDFLKRKQKAPFSIYIL